VKRRTSSGANCNWRKHPRGPYSASAGGGIGAISSAVKWAAFVYDWAENTFFTPLPEAEQPEE
jgi:hypothetical protein